LVQWRVDSFRVKYITGSGGKYYARNNPMKASDVARKPATKIIQGDWPWHANREITSPRSEWHNIRGKRVEVMLFGDGHVEFFKFPTTPDLPLTGPPDINFLWW
jgi:hypothetical protein